MFSSKKPLYEDHRVALVRCSSYDPQEVRVAIEKGVGWLGGAEAFCAPGESLLLKPNLLLGDRPEHGTTTNPAVFQAAAECFLEAGAQLCYGDSPGFGSPVGAARAAGLKDIADSLGFPLADFVAGRDTPNQKGHLLKQFHLAEGLFHVDGVINLPKFKTHGLMRLTGAVKNLFGCLPGVQKAGFHMRLPKVAHFAQMLVDLAELISPRLHIMDGVISMEGNGPRNGEKRPMQVLLFSANPYALDDCVARMMALDRNLVLTLQVAKDWGLYQPEKIQLLGDPLESFIAADFDVNRARLSTTGENGFVANLFKNWVTPRPEIDAQLCSRCGRCVTVCPAQPKALAFVNGRTESPQYDYDRCIRCYCCQEMCPEEAIAIHTPALGRLVEKIRG